VTDRVTARACSNIALVKYWGKQGAGNAPATPSIALALDALHTTVSASPIGGSRNVIKLPAGLNKDIARQRITDFIESWRRQGLIRGSFRIESESNFPAGAGLASSASAFAALAKALSAFATPRLTQAQLSRLARRGSGSAARSITGGISALPAGHDPAARLLAPAASVSWGMVVAQVSSSHKEIPSREGMESSRRTSPYYSAWLKQCARDYRAMLKAIAEPDLDTVGSIAEANMLAMHAVMQSTRPALVYWQPATLELLMLAGRLRASGLHAYATVDAGPNVALLCSKADLEAVAARTRHVSGVKRVYKGMPGGPAVFVD